MVKKERSFLNWNSLIIFHDKKEEVESFLKRKYPSFSFRATDICIKQKLSDQGNTIEVFDFALDFAFAFEN